VGIFRTESPAGFFPAGERREAYPLLARCFRKTPEHDPVQVVRIVHEYQSQKQGIKAERVVGESDRRDSSEFFTGRFRVGQDHFVGVNKMVNTTKWNVLKK
jgi:hypothetical protein